MSFLRLDAAAIAARDLWSGVNSGKALPHAAAIVAMHCRLRGTTNASHVTLIRHLVHRLGPVSQTTPRRGPLHSALPVFKAGFVPRTVPWDLKIDMAEPLYVQRKPRADHIMSITALSGSNQLDQSASLGAAKGSHRHGGGAVAEHSSGGSDEGVALFAGLLQALTQAAGTQTAAAAASTGAASTGSPATTSSGSANTLVQDLQSFLHDLFHTLRGVSRIGEGGRVAEPPPVAAPNSATAPSETAPASDASSATTTAAATAAVPAVTSTALSTGSSALPSQTFGASSTTGAGSYGQQGIITALKTLIQDLGNSQVLSTTDSSSSLSANALSNLNTAFNKLLGDLGGTASGGSTGTSALQSYLTNLLQDLQSNGTNSLSSLGSSVNTTA
jgi:hypothetical protein